MSKKQVTSGTKAKKTIVNIIDITDKKIHALPIIFLFLFFPILVAGLGPA
mgnify:CR=1 FL=1